MDVERDWPWDQRQRRWRRPAVAGWEDVSMYVDEGRCGGFDTYHACCYDAEVDFDDAPHGDGLVDPGGVLFRAEAVQRISIARNR